jgi:AcrR family transcriptional regulator
VVTQEEETVSGATVTQRTRGGERRERILAAAAELIAARGYHAVSMTDLGVAAGIVGPGIYRHFQSKAAVLASLFERVIDALLERASTIVDQARDEREALTGLVADHVSLVINDRELAIVFYRELHNLSDEQRCRLRRKQRLYLEEWVHVVAELRQELDEAEVRAVVHGAIGAIQSVLSYRETGLARERVAVRLAAMGHAVLGIAALDGHALIVNRE